MKIVIEKISKLYLRSAFAFIWSIEVLEYWNTTSVSTHDYL